MTKNTFEAMTWEDEIAALAADFLISRRQILAIIDRVKASGLTGDNAYRRAWSQLFDLM